MPKEHILQLYGPSNAGKTTIARYIIAEAQRLDERPACFIDVENKLDLDYTEKCGIDLSRLHVGRTAKKGEHMVGETALDMLVDTVMSGDYSVVAFDSVGAVVPKAVMDGDMADHHMGIVARLMTRAVQMLTIAKSGSDSVVVLLNQDRASFDPFVFEKMAGGKALFFLSSVVIRVGREGKIEKSGRQIGHYMKLSTRYAQTTKNQLGPERREVKIPLIQYKGLYVPAEIVLTGADMGIIDKRGSFYSYNENRLGAGLVQASKGVKPFIKDIAPQIMRELQRADDEIKMEALG